MIYPDNKYKTSWDTLVTMALLFTCCVTPYRIAFIQEEPFEWVVANILIDTLFLIDIFFCFVSAYYTEEFVLIDDRKTIVVNYL